MKKKILILLLALLLVSAVMIGAVACKPKKPPTPTPPTPPTPTEYKDSEFGPYFTSLSFGIDNLINAAKDNTSKVYAQATLYVIYNDTKVELVIKGSFDAKTAANNKGLVQLRINDTDYLTVYTQNSYVYIGEKLTQDTAVNWIKLSQAQGDNIITHFFQKLPGLLNENLTSDATFTDALDDLLGSLLPVSVIANVVSFITENKIPTANNVDDIDNLEMDEIVIDGNYTATLKLSGIGEFLAGLKGLLPTLDIKALVEGLDLGQGIEDIIDQVMKVLVNGTLDQFLDGAITNYPEIKICMSIKDKMLSSLCLTYDNDLGEAPIYVEFGLKDVLITGDSSTAFVPDGLNISTVKDAYLKVAVGLSLPQKGINNLVLEGYINPAVVINMDVDKDGKESFSVNFDAVNAFAIAYLNGEKIALSATYEKSMIRFDLTGIFDYLKVSPTDPIREQAKYYYTGFDFGEWVTNLFKQDSVKDPQTPAADAEAAAGTALDTFIAAIKANGLAGIVDVIMDNFGFIGEAFTAITDIAAKAYNEETQVVSIRDLLTAISETDLLADSTNIGEYIQKFAPEKAIDGLLEFINYTILKNDNNPADPDYMDKAELFALIEEFTGITPKDPAKPEDLLLDITIGAEFIQDVNKGIGVELTVKSGEEEISLWIAVDVIGTVGTVPTKPVITDGDCLDNDDEIEGQTAEQKQILDALKEILEMFKAFTPAA